MGSTESVESKVNLNDDFEKAKMPLPWSNQTENEFEK